jgi:hypothetical protein
MLYREIIAVCSEIHTKHINTLCGQNVEFVNVKPGGTGCRHKHWALNVYTQPQAQNTFTLNYNMNPTHIGVINAKISLVVPHKLVLQLYSG